jgi:magnesium chelatase subunit I
MPVDDDKQPAEAPQEGDDAPATPPDSSDDGGSPAEIPAHLLEADDTPPSSMLMRLLETRSARRVLEVPAEDMGLAEHLPYPFMALVGQLEMRTALLLTVINPNVGGVLLIGPRGTGKTTAARGLSDLLPQIEQSTCMFGCMPEDYEAEGVLGVCDECAEKLARGEKITRPAAVRLVELPLNARLEDVIGGINERAAMQQHRIRLDRGILSRADRNILYIDEVNLLDDTIIDAILDAAAQGQYTVRRGPIRATYRSRFVLIGSMNPEEGRLRPQIMDRFGLRVMVGGLDEAAARKQVYHHMRQFRDNPRTFIRAFEAETLAARDEIAEARELLPNVTLAADVEPVGLELVRAFDVHSHRAEFTMFEAARAYAAAAGREEATLDDLAIVAPLALRMRRSSYIEGFFDEQQQEDEKVDELLSTIRSEAPGDD